jgi:hypothetical protein
MRKAIFSLLHLFSVLTFLMAGVVFVLARVSPVIRLKISDFFLVHFEKCSLLAFWCFTAALVFVFSFYLLERGRFLSVRMGVSVDLEVVKTAVAECLEREFAHKILLTDLTMDEKAILEMGVSLATLEGREKLLESTEKALKVLLSKRFGYKKPFDLVIKLPPK